MPMISVICESGDMEGDKTKKTFSHEKIFFSGRLRIRTADPLLVRQTL